MAGGLSYHVAGSSSVVLFHSHYLAYLAPNGFLSVVDGVNLGIITPGLRISLAGGASPSFFPSSGGCFFSSALGGLGSSSSFLGSPLLQALAV